MSETDNQDFYESGAGDAPLIDSLGSAVKRIVEKGKTRGYITVEELNKALFVRFFRVLAMIVFRIL